jgi:hypothetical protein
VGDESAASLLHCKMMTFISAEVCQSEWVDRITRDRIETKRSLVSSRNSATIGAARQLRVVTIVHQSTKTFRLPDRERTQKSMNIIML